VLLNWFRAVEAATAVVVLFMKDENAWHVSILHTLVVIVVALFLFFFVWFDRVGLVVGNLKGCQVRKRIACLLGLLLLLVVVVLNWLRVVVAAAAVVVLLVVLNDDENDDDGELNAVEDDGKFDSPVFIVCIIIMDWLLFKLFQVGRVLAPLFINIELLLLFINGIAAAKGCIVALPLGCIMLLLLLVLPIKLPIFPIIFFMALLLLFGYMATIPPPRPAMKPDDVDDNDDIGEDAMCVTGV